MDINQQMQNLLQVDAAGIAVDWKVEYGKLYNIALEVLRAQAAAKGEPERALKFAYDWMINRNDGDDLSDMVKAWEES